MVPNGPSSNHGCDLRRYQQANSLSSFYTSIHWQRLSLCSINRLPDVINLKLPVFLHSENVNGETRIFCICIVVS